MKTHIKEGKGGVLTQEAEDVCIKHIRAMLDELRSLGENVEYCEGYETEDETVEPHAIGLNSDTYFREGFFEWIDEVLYDLLTEKE